MTQKKNVNYVINTGIPSAHHSNFSILAVFSHTKTKQQKYLGKKVEKYHPVQNQNCYDHLPRGHVNKHIGYSMENTAQFRNTCKSDPSGRQQQQHTAAAAAEVAAAAPVGAGAGMAQQGIAAEQQYSAVSSHLAGEHALGPRGGVWYDDQQHKTDSRFLSLRNTPRRWDHHHAGGTTSSSSSSSGGGVGTFGDSVRNTRRRDRAAVSIVLSAAIWQENTNWVGEVFGTITKK